MSWLSNLFGGGGEDPEAVRQRAAGQAAEENRRALQVQMDYLNRLREDEQKKEAAIAAKDPTATRQAALSSINSIFAPEFENTALPDTLGDPLEQAAYTAQRGKADEYINNLLKRGVITDTGYAAASKNLDEQGAKVRTSLDDISKVLLGAQREKVGGIAGRARSAASGLNVGDTFDVNPFASQYNTEVSNFQKGLPDAFNASITGDLFDTKSLASLAGGAQGAGNQPFDPSALAGTNIPLAGGGGSPLEDPFAPKKPTTPERTSTVF
jgi:hypothetical protein